MHVLHKRHGDLVNQHETSYCTLNLKDHTIPKNTSAKVNCKQYQDASLINQAIPYTQNIRPVRKPRSYSTSVTQREKQQQEINSKTFENRKYSFELSNQVSIETQDPLHTFEKHFNSKSKPLQTNSFQIDGADYLQIYKQLEPPILYQSKEDKKSKINSFTTSNKDNQNMLVPLENRNQDQFDIDIDDIDPIETFYQDTAFFCLSKKSTIRGLAIRLTMWPLKEKNCRHHYWGVVACGYFERLTMTIILLNCITLGLYDPMDTECRSQKCHILEGLETFIYSYFVFEMFVKMLAFGIFGKLGYLAESWNRLDCFIVAAGTFELAYGDGEFLSSVRAVRVLRPLRAINRVPSIRILVTLLLDTLPMLGNVFLLCVLILMVFAIIGVQLWQGILRNRCFLDLPHNASIYVKNNSIDLNPFYENEEDNFICSSALNNGDLKCEFPLIQHYISRPSLTKCNMTFDAYMHGSNDTSSGQCIDWNSYYTKCIPNASNPFYGAISFDNAGEAFIAIFQAITLEGWADIMYYLQDAYSSWVWIYFVALIVFGSYFLTNLCLVVVATQFSETRQRESALMEAARKRATSSTILTSSVNSVSKGCYNQILSLLRYYIRKAIRRMRRKFVAYRSRKQMQKQSIRNRNGDIDSAAVHFHHHHHHHIHHHHLHLCPSATEQGSNNNTNRGSGSHNRAIENSVSNNELVKHENIPDASASNIPNIMPPLPSITIDEIDGDVLKPLKSLPMNTTTALIIPDTTVVICPPHASFDSKRQSATLSFIPSVSNYHNAESYRSVGDASLSELDLSEEELQRLEKEVCPSGCSQYGGSIDEDCKRRRRRKRKETKCSKARLKVKSWCETNWFKTAIMGAIFLNTVTMAVEHHEQPHQLTVTLDIFNAMFTTLFTIEFLMKFYGYGFYGYIKDAFNVFDATIVIISLVELAGSEQGGVSVLRTFRLMRIFKLVRFLPTLQKQIQVMLETLDSVMTFLGLLTIFIFTSSILGMHLFGGKLVFDGESVRHNFDNLMWSLITVFQVLTQEDWNSVLYDAMRATTKWASVYFVVLMIIGNYILFNLLVAILVEGFSTETDGILSSPIKYSSDNAKNTSQLNGINNMYLSPYDMRGTNTSSSMPNIKSDHMYDIQEDIRRAASETAMDQKKEKLKTEEKSKGKDKEKNKCCTSISCQNCCNFEILNKRRRWTCYLISNDNRLRKLSKDVINNPWFDNVILFFILLNCVIMAMERPNIAPESLERKIIDYSNHVFTGVFTIEMIIKIFALGFYCGEKTTYLKSNWNRIDFILVIISLVDIFVTYVVQSESGVLGMLKVFRAFRTLRPLRVISRAPGLKIVVETLIASLAPIGNLLVVAMVFFTIFGILGVQLFKGKFYYCNIENDEDIITKSDCLKHGHPWINKKYNFDNLFQALFTLFVFATKDGWVSLMYDGIDAVDVDKQPKKNNNPWAFLYFVSFLLIAGFVVINMVVGVIIDNFQKCRVMVEEEYDGALPSDDSDNETNNNGSKNKCDKNLTSSTKHGSSVNNDNILQTKERTGSTSTNTHASYHSNNSSNSMTQKNYEIPENLDEYNAFRRGIFTVVSHYKFDLFIAVIIGLNVLFMAIEFYQMPEDLIYFLKITNYIFTAIFILEAIFKIYGFGPRLFFAQRWNQLDVVIVFLSIIGIVFEELNSSLPINPTIIRIMRVLRIARVLKILKAADGIQRLLNCVTEAIPQVGNLSMLFLLIFFIFSALGIELFGHLDCSLDECYGINRHAHFKNFGYALLTLFRISTGDNWSGILKDAINPNLCKDPCSMMPYVAPVYFAVFVLASQFVLVNVVVAVLMKQLEDAKTIQSVGDQSEENNNLSDAEQNDFDKLKLLELDQLSLAEKEPLLVASRKGNFNITNQENEKSPEHYKRYLQLSLRRPNSSLGANSLTSVSNPSLYNINSNNNGEDNISFISDILNQKNDDTNIPKINIEDSDSNVLQNLPDSNSLQKEKKINENDSKVDFQDDSENVDTEMEKDDQTPDLNETIHKSLPKNKLAAEPITLIEEKQSMPNNNIEVKNSTPEFSDQHNDEKTSERTDLIETKPLENTSENSPNHKNTVETSKGDETSNKDSISDKPSNESNDRIDVKESNV